MKRQGLVTRALRSLPMFVVLIAGAAAPLAGCSSAKQSAQAQTAHASFEAAGVLSPVTAAPPLALRNYLGQPVNIDSYRGRAVLVTFLYTHCPDVCPLIASNLGVADRLLPVAVAARTVMIAVSVDPRGDTPKAVAAFLAHHQVTGRLQYLIGSAHELARVWKAWGVGSERDLQNPEQVNHTGIVYGVTGSGERLTLYASNFQPAEIAHDIPLLAAR
jgi:protein SCO1/2